MTKFENKLKRGGYIIIGQLRLSHEHLLIILILGIIFTSAFVMRSFPLQYGFYLHEYDPYFNLRATQYLIDHGLDAYWNWHDTMSWYPEGRDVAKTSQSGLHIVTAILYFMFGQGSLLINFTFLFPALISSFTTIIVFFFVRMITHSNIIGLFGSFLFAVSPPLVIRGSLGWFKSEPLGLFLGLSAICLFLLCVKHTSNRYLVPASLLGGVLLGVGNASWNGVQFFAIPIAIFMFILPFYQKNNNKNLKYYLIIFSAFAIITTALFPRSGMSSIFNPMSIVLTGGTMFYVIVDLLKISQSFRKNEKRNILFVLLAFVIFFLIMALIGGYYIADVKYLAVINPFYDRPTFTESVAEHVTPTIIEYAIYFSTLSILAVIGVYTILRHREKILIFAFIISLSGLYISTTMTRLLVFASIAMIILSSIGIGKLVSFGTKNNKSPYNDNEPKDSNIEQRSLHLSSKYKRTVSYIQKIRPRRFIIIGIVFVLVFIPLVYPTGLTWIDVVNVPQPILNGNTGQYMKINDWIDALDWIARNTTQDSVIASWWDYGYWITTMGNRTTLSDNAANNQTRIETIAKMFMENSTQGLDIARSLKSDYILLYTVARPMTINAGQYYILGNGGDESKLYTMFRLSGYPTAKFLESDEFTRKPSFWNNTLLGQLMPFVPKGYVLLSDEQQQSKLLRKNIEILNLYYPGSFAIYTIKDIQDLGKINNLESNVSLVYYSESIENADIITAVLAYKIKSD